MSAAAVLVASGLAGEARIAAGPGVVVLAAPPVTLAGHLAALDAAGLCAVVSFGLAGGLDPALAVGDIVLADRIVGADAAFACDPASTDRIAAALAHADLPVIRGPFAAADGPVLLPRDKRALGIAREAIAVDTESLLAAEFAARHELPFSALRVISDPADRALPQLAVRAIGPNGRLDGGAILAELVRRPGQLAALPGTARAAGRAMRTLGRVRAALGPGFGLLP